MKYYYLIETIDPIIISQTPATLGIHKGLDYIPGSSILGAIAAQIYDQFEKTDLSWEIFHSGKVKFSDAYIAQTLGEKFTICNPTPLSWHIPKGETLYQVDQLNPNIENHIHENEDQDSPITQKQCRAGYISPNGLKVQVKQGSSTKTAINKNTETVDESQLFSYNYIHAGQHFIGWIETEQEVEQLKRALNNINRIGRSRSTEFGRVKVKPLMISEKSSLCEAVNKGSIITLWLTSDCQIIDQMGFPVVTPSAQDIGLCHAELLLTKSFINTHNKILYNSHRQGFDSEQTLLSKGSILVYEALADISGEQLDKIQKKGIGINQQLGYGNVIINPDWAKHFSPVKQDLSTKLFDVIQCDLHNGSSSFSHRDGKLSGNTQSPLIKWISQQVKTKEDQEKRNDQVHHCVQQILNFYLKGRVFNGISNLYNAGPTKTQWGIIFEATRNTKTAVKRLDIDASRTTDQQEWSLNWAEKGGVTTFQKSFEKLFFALNGILTQRQLLEKLNLYHLETYKGIKALKESLPGEYQKQIRTDDEVTA